MRLDTRVFNLFSLETREKKKINKTILLLTTLRSNKQNRDTTTVFSNEKDKQNFNLDDQRVCFDNFFFFFRTSSTIYTHHIRNRHHVCISHSSKRCMRISKPILIEFCIHCVCVSFG